VSTVVRFCIISRRFCHIWKISQTLFASRHLFDRDHSLSPSHPCDQVRFRVRNKRRPLSNLWKVTSVAKPKMPFVEIATS
jgi:hypothetical protein